MHPNSKSWHLTEFSTEHYHEFKYVWITVIMRSAKSHISWYPSFQKHCILCATICTKHFRVKFLASHHTHTLFPIKCSAVALYSNYHIKRKHLDVKSKTVTRTFIKINLIKSKFKELYLYVCIHMFIYPSKHSHTRKYTDTTQKHPTRK